jgi:hypothetical protein
MNACKATLSSLLLAFGICATAQTTNPAQKEPRPEEMQEMMQAIGVMVPAMGQMTEAMVNAQLSIAARPDTAEKLATFKKNLYDALLKKGFTPEQAIQIVVAANPPSATLGGK